MVPLELEKLHNLLTVLHLLASFHLNSHLFEHVCRLVQWLDLAMAQERLGKSLVRIGYWLLWMREPGRELFNIALVVFWCIFNVILVLICGRCYACRSYNLELAHASTVMGDFYWALLSSLWLLLLIASLGQKIDLNLIWHVFAHVFGSKVMGLVVYDCHCWDSSLLHRFHREVSRRCHLTTRTHQFGKVRVPWLIRVFLRWIGQLFTWANPRRRTWGPHIWLVWLDIDVQSIVRRYTTFVGAMVTLKAAPMDQVG